jgi:hypothetical protein
MSNTKSATAEKVFEEVWTYRSDISGSGVRGKVDLVFEVERILQLFSWIVMTIPLST